MMEYTVLSDWGGRETTETYHSKPEAENAAEINFYLGGALYTAVLDPHGNCIAEFEA